MNKYNIIITLSVLWLLTLPCSTSAQTRYEDEDAQNSTYYYVKTKDNTRFTGRVLYRNRRESEIVFELYDDYEVVVLTSNIQSMRRVKSSEIRDGEYLYPDVNGGRYLIMPNGIGMQAKQLQYKTTNLLYHSFHYGITDYLSVHAGGELYTSLSLGQPSYNFGLNMHLPLSSNLYLGTHLSYANIYGDYQNTVSIYSYLTAGSANTNISMGFGYGQPMMTGENPAPTSFIPVSGKIRLSKTISLVTENWLFLDKKDFVSDVGFSYGIRMNWENYALDLAFISSDELRNWFVLGLPMMSFTYAIK